MPTSTETREMELFHALTNRRYDDVRALLSRGVKPNRLAVNEAIKTGSIEFIRAFIDQGIVNNGTTPDGNFYEPLMKAIDNGNKGIVKLLLDAGSNVNDKGAKGDTPLHRAIKKGKVMVKLLLDAGANVNAKDANGETPMWVETRDWNRGKEILKLLLDFGANPNERDRNGDTLLNKVSGDFHCHDDIVKLLLDSGAKVNLKSQSGSTPLHSAIERGHDSIIKLLLDAGADVNVKDGNGLTPVQLAASVVEVNTMKLMLTAGGDLNLKDSRGSTIFQRSLSNSDIKVPKLIFEVIGADVNTRRHDNKTFLHIAAEKSEGMLVKYLLAQGAHVNARDDAGQTPLHLAAKSYFNQECHLTAARTLIEKGADIFAVDKNGKMPIDLLNTTGDKYELKIVNLLTGQMKKVWADKNEKAKSEITAMFEKVTKDVNDEMGEIVKKADILEKKIGNMKRNIIKLKRKPLRVNMK